MFLASLRPNAWRLAAALLAASLPTLSAIAQPTQMALGSGTYVQTFDGLPGGLPTGWAAYTGATATALGTAATFNTAAVSWTTTSGQWANQAAADNNGAPFTGTESTAVQAAAADRALAIRQTGTFGDPGASANFYFSTIGQQITSISFKAQMLSVQLRSTTWSLQYGLGAIPAAWTTVATYADPGVFGSTNVIASGFGTALDNQPNVWLRIVALAGSTGSSSRDTFGIDDFTVVASATSSATPPSITTSPSSQTVTEGDTVHLAVVAAGDAPLTYQWRKNSSPLGNGGSAAGATSANLTLTGVVPGDSGNYDVVVANAAGSATSAAAALTVQPLLNAPAITGQPASQTVAVGGNAGFTVTATGTAPLTYQWRKGGAPLADGTKYTGTTTASLSVHSVTADDAGAYDVVVSNGVSPDATSNAATLAIAPLVTPSGQVAYAGGSYAQSFDTLPSTGTYTLTSSGPLALDAAPVGASGLGGWTFAKYAGAGLVALFRVDAGTGTSGSIYSYGSAAATDRALGSLSSGSTVSRFGLTLVNSTGQAITQFTLSYTGEQWRRGTGAANRLAFEYALDATDINTGDFTAANPLDFTAPVTAGSGAALDGNAAANRLAISATITGLNWAPGQTLTLRWTDVDDTGSDDGLGIDDLSFSTPVAAGDVLPAVVYTTPATGAVNVPVASAVAVAFNEAVQVAPSSFALTGAVSGAHAFTLAGGPSSYSLTPDSPFAEGELVTLTVNAAAVTDATTGTHHPATDYTASFITFSSAPLPIHTIQGAGLTSPYKGYTATVQGVVTATFQAAGAIGGYYIETPDAQQDADPATSEGIYVFDNANSVTVGDLVTVTGTVTEYLSSGAAATMTQTEMSVPTAVTVVSSGNPLPSAVPVTLPFASASAAERYEGMRVTFPQSLTVTDNYDLGHFGEVLLSNGRLPQPTNIVAPGAPAQAQEAANLLNQILLDDGLSTTYPSPTPFLNGADPATATRRTGSTAASVTGILDTRFGLYVVEPTATPVFTDANPRAAAPASFGTLRVVFGNVENFMNGDGLGGGFPTSRGATSYAEYQRQLAKVTAGILGLAPDIMGLSEVENDKITNGEPDSYGPTSAIAQLVASLNASAPAGTTYVYVNAAAVDIVTDLIHSAIIYRVETVEPVGAPAMLDNVYFNNHARNPLAQAFRQKSTGAKFTFCVNHFRAKASASSLTDGISPNPNNDQGDGQGTNNYIRTKEAQALTAWLATDPTGSGDPRVLIVGDLNSYAKEDPITAITAAGYQNVVEHFEGATGWSYAFNGEFGHLDHALASPSLATEVMSAATWHTNSDEPVFYDYTLANKDVAQQAINAGTPYRYSDHDPVVVGLNLSAVPTITAVLSSQVATVGGNVTFSITAIGSPAPTFQWRRNGVAIPGATSSTYTISGVLTANAGDYDVVVANSAGAATSNTATLAVNPAPAGLTLSNLVSAYDGTPHPVTVTTSPLGLPVTVTYDGSTTAPTNPGTYAVVATSGSPDYTGSIAGNQIITVTALVRHAPTLNGAIDGSVQVLLSESVTLNGGAAVTSDLLVPGLPAVKLNGHPDYAGTTDGTGAATPANFTITLNGSSMLRHVVRRIDPIPLPVVVAPPASAGTRNVTLNKAGDTPGDFATLRNLTLNGNAGQVEVPPGTYGAFTANGSSSFVFGVAGASTPAVYNLQDLALNGNSRLVIAGPVVLTLANGTTLNGSVGSSDHPEWLSLEVASGGVTINGGASFDGFVVAPNGAVTINGNCRLTGNVAADRLTINGNGVLAEPQF
ncbi:MAG TPA: ExeM/NucH family extracellular endonuclease [Lacunisphaera sp.]|jgi:predicted extracellular nuclease|nr:ExeM/NucH family extracellular endonuclease [Lacunisphaera sp.]